MIFSQKNLSCNCVVTARKRSLGQGNIFTTVCQSFCSQGEREYLGRYPPGPGTPSRTRYTSQDQVHPPGPGTPPRPGTPTRDQVHPPDQIHPPATRYTPLGPGIPPLGTRYTPRQTRYIPRARYTPPPASSACWEIRATSGRIHIVLECILVLSIFDPSPSPPSQQI